MIKGLELSKIGRDLEINETDTKVFKNFFSLLDDPKNSFFHLVKRTDLLNQSKETYLKFHKKKHIVLIGIGGSSLGPEMLIESLSSPSSKSERKFYIINNIDSQEIAETFEQLENTQLQEILFIVTSKSGTTIETTAGLALAMNWLSSKQVEIENKLKDFFVFITDPQKSELLDLGKKHQVDCLEIPQTIGGRFSVLSPVGLLPSLFAGIDVEELWKGALDASEEIKASHDLNNPLLQLGKFLFELGQKGYAQTVFIPYSSKIKQLAFWFVQLWAESLGKANDLQGNLVNTGLTPIPAHGATDQHSQMQLFMEGPHDKVLMVIEIENSHHNFSLEAPITDGALGKLRPFTLNQLMKAELTGTLKALEQNNRAFAHLKMPELNAYQMGKAILELESLTALMSVYLNVDCFDQPGVEASKKFALEWLDANKNS